VVQLVQHFFVLMRKRTAAENIVLCHYNEVRCRCHLCFAPLCQMFFMVSVIFCTCCFNLFEFASFQKNSVPAIMHQICTLNSFVPCNNYLTFMNLTVINFASLKHVISV
jgi:hypothetical protein